jgi:tetratricopeptide (TPR) repeat protein
VRLRGFSIVLLGLGCLLLATGTGGVSWGQQEKDAKFYFDRGLEWAQKGELDKALADFTEAIRLNPKEARAYTNRGNVWMLKKDYDQAIADYTEAIRLNPKMAEAYNNRGLAWIKKGDVAKAQADLEMAKKLGFPVPKP